MQEARKLSKEMDSEVGADSDKSRPSLWRRIVAFGALLIFVFLLGFVPAWLAERDAGRQRDAAQTHLRLSQLQNRLATAAINSRRGEYEPARVAASDFFTDLRAEVDRRESAFTAGQIEAVRPILAERDELITQLARYDQATVERLTDLYLNYVQAINPSAQKSR